MEGTLQHDITHLKTHYHQFFTSLEVLSETEETILFELVALNQTSVTCTLTVGGFAVVSESQVFETFEGLLSHVMGHGEYAKLFSRLVSEQLGN